MSAKATGAGWKRSLGPDAPTLAEQLGAHGYVTAGFVANQHCTTWETGLARGFHRWDDFDAALREAFWASSLAQMTIVRELVRAPWWSERARALRAADFRVQPEPEHERRSGAHVVDRFLRWHATLGERPYFAFLNLFDAHDPYVQPPDWSVRYSEAPSGQDTYESAIGYMDAQLGRLFDTLRAQGQLDNTIVIVASDHGEQFGEHSLFLHGNSLYLASLHVPLIIRYPTLIPAGLQVQAPVSLSRVAATITDLAGIHGSPLGGKSLRPTWGSATATGGEGQVSPSWIEQRVRGASGEPATLGALTSLVDDSTHWIQGADRTEQLFLYRQDPREPRSCRRRAVRGSARTASRGSQTAPAHSVVCPRGVRAIPRWP